MIIRFVPANETMGAKLLRNRDKWQFSLNITSIVLRKVLCKFTGEMLESVMINVLLLDCFGLWKLSLFSHGEETKYLKYKKSVDVLEIDPGISHKALFMNKLTSFPRGEGIHSLLTLPQLHLFFTFVRTENTQRIYYYIIIYHTIEKWMYEYLFI